MGLRLNVIPLMAQALRAWWVLHYIGGHPNGYQPFEQEARAAAFSICALYYAALISQG